MTAARRTTARSAFLDARHAAALARRQGDYAGAAIAEAEARRIRRELDQDRSAAA